jgi:hypothetical protein
MRSFRCLLIGTSVVMVAGLIVVIVGELHCLSDVKLTGALLIIIGAIVELIGVWQVARQRPD